MDTTILLVARLPCRQAKPSAYIISAFNRIVTRERMDTKPTIRVRVGEHP
jgi:hypothetical protein